VASVRRSSLVALVSLGVLVAAGSLWFLVGRQHSAAKTGGPVALDSPLPSIDGRSLVGTAIDTSSLRGHVAVISAWATWCEPCRREQPGLVRLARRYGDRVRFMGIDYRDDRAAALRWATTEFHVPYPSLYDADGRSASELKYPYLPDTYVVDASGRIRWAIYGEATEQEVGRLVDGLLGSSASP
jgi:thiol-disulfide isomerase/thioredoxin